MDKKVHQWSYKVTSVLFALCALYLVVDSVKYTWTVYDAVYRQQGLVVLILCILFTNWLAFLGIGILFYSFAMVFTQQSIIGMVLMNLLCMGMSLVAISWILPFSNAFIVMLFGKVFGK